MNARRSRIRNLVERRAQLQRFSPINAAETVLIEQRRRQAGLSDEPGSEPDILGLSLSGGGVRSATFNLGVLQALHQYDFLRRVDYLSTVSGGGYIGSSLSWFLFKHGRFPFPRYPRNDTAARPGEWLKRHASYLVPGDGLNLWALIAAVGRGIFINLLIFIPILFGAMFYLSYTPDFYIDLQVRYLPWFKDIPPAFVVILAYAALSLIYLALAFFLYALWSRKRPIPFFKHRRYSAQYGRILFRAIVAIAVGVIPFVGNWISSQDTEWDTEMAALISSLIGSLSIVLGWLFRKSGPETAGIRAFALRFGLTVLVYGLFLWFYQLSVGQWQNVSEPGSSFLSLPWFHVVLAALIGVSMILGVTADINHVSMHRYYRDRLLEAFMPDRFKTHGQRWSSDDFLLTRMDPASTGAPLQIVNANITLLESSEPRYRIRGGDSFSFTPLYTGSKATGWVPTAEYLDDRLDLATAMSISGAAVDPNTGATRSRPLAFVMSFLNVRLGYWTLNPLYSGQKWAKRTPWLWHYYVVREMLGWRIDEYQRYVHLSDGGHFENLGLYELVRRRCRYIIATDAGADPHWKFQDLARAIERIRADFRAEIEIDTQLLQPDPDSRISKSPFVIGSIRYNDGTTGRLLYLKTALCPGLPEDIYGYHRENAEFPNESTTDQFFGDQQFEAYRELGYRLMESALHDKLAADIASVFKPTTTEND